jgi:hypothetical protein
MRFRVVRGGPAGEIRPQEKAATEPNRQETARPTQSGEHAAQAARRAALQNPYGRYYSAPRTPEDLVKAKR